MWIFSLFVCLPGIVLLHGDLAGGISLHMLLEGFYIGPNMWLTGLSVLRHALSLAQGIDWHHGHGIDGVLHEVSQDCVGGGPGDLCLVGTGEHGCGYSCRTNQSTKRSTRSPTPCCFKGTTLTESIRFTWTWQPTKPKLSGRWADGLKKGHEKVLWTGLSPNGIYDRVTEFNFSKKLSIVHMHKRAVMTLRWTQMGC